jgi:hypothetical protein
VERAPRDRYGPKTRIAPVALAVVPFARVTVMVSGLAPGAAVSGTATPTRSNAVSRAPSATDPDFGNPGQLRVLVSVHGIVNALLLSFPSCQRVVALESPANALSAEMNATASIEGRGEGCGGCGGRFGVESGGAAVSARGASGLPEAAFPRDDAGPLLEQLAAITVRDASTPAANNTRVLIDASSEAGERTIAAGTRAGPKGVEPRMVRARHRRPTRAVSEPGGVD